MPDDVLEDGAEDEEDAAEGGGVYAGGDTVTDVLNGILVVIPAPEGLEVTVDEAAEVELVDNREELVEATMNDIRLNDGEALSEADELVETKELDEDFELDGHEVVNEELADDIDVVEAPAGELYAGGPAKLPLLLEETDDDDRLDVEKGLVIAEEDIVELLVLLVLMRVLLLLDGALYPGGVAALVDEKLDMLGVELELPDLELELVASLDVLIAMEVVLLVVAPGDESGGGTKGLVVLTPELDELEGAVDEVDVP